MLSFLRRGDLLPMKPLMLAIVVASPWLSPSAMFRAPPPTLTLARLSLAQPRKHTDPEQDMQGYLLDAGEELARLQD
jgi:hypothetical protein